MIGLYIIYQEMKKFFRRNALLQTFLYKDVMVTEFTGESKEIKKLKISIIFTDDDDKIKNMKY